MKSIFAQSQVILSDTVCRAREENIVENDILMKIKELQLDVLNNRNELTATHDLCYGRNIPTGKLLQSSRE